MSFINILRTNIITIEGEKRMWTYKFAWGLVWCKFDKPIWLWWYKERAIKFGKTYIIERIKL